MILIRKWQKEIHIKVGVMMLNIQDFAKLIIDDVLTSSDIAVDCTLGNGNDTLTLCKKAKHVYGFDIQKQALVNTKKLLCDNQLKNFTLIHDGHQNVDVHISEEIGLAIFNLGYLPNADKSITTSFETTLVAIDKILTLLKVGGVCIVVVYTGHEAGKIESIKINEYATHLDRFKYNVLKYDFINKQNPPHIIAIEKRK